MDIEDRVNRMAVDLDILIRKAEIWQSLFDECPLGIAVLTADMKFYLINREFTEMTGHSVDILGKDLKQVLPARFRRAHKKYEKDYSANPEKKVNRHGLSPGILRADGKELPVDIDLSFIRYDGKVYYVAFIRRIPGEVL